MPAGEKSLPAALVVWVTTWLVALVVVTLLFSLGLILVEFLLYPLALGVAAVIVGLTAAGAANLLLKDGLRARATGVVAATEIAAALLAVLLIAAGALGWLPSPPILVSAVSGSVLAVVAAARAITVRHVPEAVPGERRRILIWIVVAVAAIPVVVVIASFLGWAGA